MSIIGDYRSCRNSLSSGLSLFHLNFTKLSASPAIETFHGEEVKKNMSFLFWSPSRT